MNKVWKQLTGGNDNPVRVKKAKRSAIWIAGINKDGEVFLTATCNKDEIHRTLVVLFDNNKTMQYANIIMLNGHIKAAHRKDYISVDPAEENTHFDITD